MLLRYTSLLSYTHIIITWYMNTYETWYMIYDTHTHIQPYHLFVNIFLVFCCWTNPGEFQVHLKVHPEVISRKLLSLHVIRALTWQRSWIWHHQHPTRCRWTLDWKDGFFQFWEYNIMIWWKWFWKKHIYITHVCIYIYVHVYIHKLMCYEEL